MTFQSSFSGTMPLGAAANNNADPQPLRLRIPTLLDVVLVSDPQQIVWLNQQQAVTRRIDPNASLLHRVVASRLLSDLAFHGKLLPVFLTRGDQLRAQRQKQLEEKLDNLRGAPGQESDEIAQYVSGKNAAAEIGVQVQQWCGKLFLSHYRATRESYEAGSLIASWSSAPPWRTLFDKLSGKLDRAKDLLWQAADGDPHIIHATAIGMENITKTVRALRRAAHQAEKQRLSPDAILRECLFAPPALLRACTAELQAPFLKQPLGPRSLIVFLVAKAYKNSGDLDVAFMGDQWSACPARHVVPDMLRSAWRTAIHDEPPQDQGVLSKINGWGKLWTRGAS